MASNSNELDKLRQRAEEAEAKMAEIYQLLQTSNTTTTTTTVEDDSKQKQKQQNNRTNDDTTATLTVDAIITRLSNTNYKHFSKLEQLLGNPNNNTNIEWKGVECGDGNINYIFIIESSNHPHSKSIVVKQAPPFIRLVGPVWPLKPTRIDFEVKYTQYLNNNGKDMNDMDNNNSEFKQLCANNSGLEIFFYDEKSHLFCMEDLSNCVIFRSEFGLSNSKLSYYPNIGSHIGYMLGNMLFKTSDLYLSIEKKTQLMIKFLQNIEMVSISEQVIFEEPYYEADNNRRKIGNNIVNDKINKSIFNLRNDKLIIYKIYKMRQLFRNQHESLLHGDLHTGSLMVNMTRTVAIDAEFSFFGPMAFDIGQIIGNMALGLLSQPIYNKLYENEDRSKYCDYICEQICDIWNIFDKKFMHLWKKQENGNLYPKSMRNTNSNNNNNSDFDLKEFKKSIFMKRIFNQSLDFAGCAMIRRCIGLADAPEYRVKDEKMRDICEDRAIRFAHAMLLKPFETIEEFTQALQKFE